MKQGMDLKDKIYQQFQQAQTSGQFNGTWNQYAQENFYNLPDVMQLKSTHDKYTSFLKSCFGNQMPAPQSGMLQNPDYNNIPALPSVDNHDLSSVPSDNLGPSLTGNDLGLGNNSPNTIQNDQQNQLPTISSPMAVQGLLSSSHGIPPWVKGIAGWWAEGKISDNDFVTAIKFLVQHGIIKV
jgi:hypothetical protein